MMTQEKLPIPRSSLEFLRYISKNTEHIYMISEFIDNSIQSAIDTNMKDLFILIKIDMVKKCMIIKDNAGGIPYKNRSAALQPGKNINDIGKTLNMFGVGMKMASIWFVRKIQTSVQYIKLIFNVLY